MTEWQVLMQLRKLLRDRTWTDQDGTAIGSQKKVFGDNVIVSAGTRDTEILGRLSLPAAVIVPGPSEHDGDDDPRVLTSSPIVKLIQAVEGDGYGQAAMIGANIDQEGESSGKGVLEIQEQVFLAVEQLQQNNAVWIRLNAIGEAVPVELEGFGMVVVRDLQFVARVTTRRLYPPVPVLNATGGAGQVVLSWTLPPSRYDLLRVKLRRSTGATAPATHTSGTAVALGGDLVTSVTDTGLAAGTYSYSIFAMYDERSATPTDEDFASEARSRTSITVT